MSEKFYNGLAFKGSDDQEKQVLEYLKGKSEDDGSQMKVDFKTVIPMPEELFDKLYFAPNDAFSYNTGKLPDEFDYNLMAKRIDWSYENWGCKYNAYDANIDHKRNCIGLFLLGGDALPVIKKLSEIFPKLVFVYHVVGESSNHHLYTLYAGDIVKYYDLEYISMEMHKNGTSQYNSLIDRELYEIINPELKQDKE